MTKHSQKKLTEEQLEQIKEIIREKKLVIPRLAPDALKDFIFSYVAGDIYTNVNVPQNLIGQIFIPLALGALVPPYDDLKSSISEKLKLPFKSLSKEDQEKTEDVIIREWGQDIGCLWANLKRDKTTAMSINGYPMFIEMHVMHKDDYAKAADAINEELRRRKELTL